MISVDPQCEKITPESVCGIEPGARGGLTAVPGFVRLLGFAAGLREGLLLLTELRLQTEL